MLHIVHAAMGKWSVRRMEEGKKELQTATNRIR